MRSHINEWILFMLLHARSPVCGLLLLVGLMSTTVAFERPNIVIILADDQDN